MKLAPASVSAISRKLMKEPPLPCETTISGSLSPLIGQSFTPGIVLPSRTTSPGGSEHGDHIPPLRAGPSASAGTSMDRRPAACESAAGRHRAIATRNFEPCMRGSPDGALRHVLMVEFLLWRFLELALRRSSRMSAVIECPLLRCHWGTSG